MALFPQLKKTIPLLAVFICLSLAPAAQEQALYVAQPRHASTWTDLTFEGSKFFTDIKLHMQLQPADNKSADVSQGDAAKSENLPEATDENMLLSIHSSARGPGFSEDQYEEGITFNIKSLRPTSRIRISRTREKWVKSYYWQESGVRRQKIVPANSQEDKQPPNTWTKLSTSFYDYPNQAEECSTISDPSLLLYILSTHKSDAQKEPYKICVFGKKQLHRLTIKMEQSSPMNVSYTQRTSVQEAEVKCQRSSFVFSIEIETFAPRGDKQEDFSFFGLHKDILIYIDPQTNIPLRVSGTNNTIGKIVLDLTKVTENRPDVQGEKVSDSI